ncbi:hypothetical protein FACS1894178_5540 [Bacteroidia bacterium]|nr:hypothetical protein FACS1894178_5540 [Bacteroidia bacterium]
MTKKDFTSMKDRILRGLEIVHKKLILDKKSKNAKLVVLKNNRVVKVDPEKTEAQ